MIKTLGFLLCLLLPWRLIVAQTGPWTIQSSGTTSYLYAVKSLDLNVGWIGGAGGVVLRTTNGGITWASVGGGAIGSNDVYVIDALNADTAFVSTTPSTSTYIYRTTNGGTSWSQVFSQAGGFIDIVHMRDSLSGMSIGDPVAGRWTILRTTDGGVSWSHDLNEPLQIGLEAFSGTAFVGRTHAWLTTNLTKIYRSTDGGFSWTAVVTPYAFSSIGFSDTLNGVAGVSSGTVGRSTDGGLSWVGTTLSGTGSLWSLGGTTQAGFFASRGAVVYRSMDGGMTWLPSFPGGIGTITHMSFAATGPFATRGWAVSSMGGIASGYFGPDLGVNDPPVAGRITLYQNFPNPFNPRTTVSFFLPHASFVTLQLFDLVGREVATLVHEEMQPGRYERPFDGIDLASGVYLCRLRVDESQEGRAGSYAQTRKLLLLR